MYAPYNACTTNGVEYMGALKGGNWAKRPGSKSLLRLLINGNLYWQNLDQYQAGIKEV